MSVPSPPDPDSRVEGLKKAFRRPLGFPNRVGTIFLVVLAFSGAALLGRVGTDTLRLVAALLLLLFLITGFVLRRIFAKKWREPNVVLYQTLRRVDGEQAERTVRAYSLVRRLERTDSSPESLASGESPELARLHWERLLDGVSLDSVKQAGQKVRRRRMWGVAVLGGLCFWLLFFQTLSLIEGVDVMLARNGQAPFPLAYVSQVSVTAEWPSYLDGTGKKRFVSSQLTAVPAGAEIEVRVVPRIESRKLLLTDGIDEVPLLSDGHGGRVARWTAKDPSALRVAARFGDVLVFDTHETLLAPLEDRPPTVALSGAPAEIALEELDQLPLKFIASDDHGLTQVDLVLRSGQRTSRKELAHLDGQRPFYQGGTTLTREHELLRRAFLPVRVTIEARDGNTAGGPAWGVSQAIVLIPEPLGTELAERHRALRRFRKAMSTYLAENVRAAHLSLRESDEALKAAHEVLSKSFSQLESSLLERNAPKSSLAFIRAQLEALTKPREERTRPEAALLAVDALIQNLAGRDAQTLAKNLGSAVEEIAVQSRELRFGTEGVHLDGLRDLLRGAQDGAKQLKEVGRLGVDLGSVARADLSRIERSVNAGSFGRAEVAAIHLAERLKRANPSFSSQGGAGVESGTPQRGQGSGQGAPGPASDAPEQFQELAKQVDQLAQESAEELSTLEKLIEEAARAAHADFEPDEELRNSTDSLREALARLPQSGLAPGGPRAEAASARSQGEAMADALETGNLDEAVERGLDANEALKRAQALAEENPGWVMPRDLQAAQEALERVLKETQQAAAEVRRASNQGAQRGLDERAQRQREFSDRAKSLAEKSREPGAPLPTESAESLERASRLLQQAAQALEQGRPESGAELAQEAQRQLERSLPEPSESEQPESGEGEGSEQARHGGVPDEERDRARDFRKRVEKGLGRGSGRLAPAVRRYAEELK